jgi:AcrR family transcriptional regulator
MKASHKPARQGRNKAFDESHRAMIETAARLISERGAEALSIAAIARELGIDRTTVYYHFANRDALMEAVASWASEQLAVGMDLGNSQLDRIEKINRFVLENPALIKLWIDGFVSGGDIRESYGRWDELVAGTRRRFEQLYPGEQADAEAYCAMLLSSAIVGLRVFAKSLGPQVAADEVLARFSREQQRLLALQGLGSAPAD